LSFSTVISETPYYRQVHIFNTMDNFQVTLVNIFILALWCVIVPCLSAAIYLFFSKSEQKQNVKGSKKYLTISILLLISISLLLVVSNATIVLQTINPLCVGVGDPKQMMCFSRGFVPMSEAIAINNDKTLSDLVRTISIPIIASLGLAFISLRVQNWNKAKTKNAVQ
jgi:hypothetical protein